MLGQNLVRLVQNEGMKIGDVLYNLYFFFVFVLLTESEEQAPPAKLNFDDDFFLDSSASTGKK